MDGPLTAISVYPPHKRSTVREYETLLMKVQTFMHTRNQQRRMHAILYGMSDHIQVGEQVPRPNTNHTATGIMRAIALHTASSEKKFGGQKRLNGDQSRRRVLHKEKLERVIGLENHDIRILECTWFNSDHSAVHCEASTSSIVEGRLGT